MKKKISEERLFKLLKEEAKLRLLEGGGVDNWEGYEICLDEDYGVADKDDLDLVSGNLSQDEIKNILSTYEDI